MAMLQPRQRIAARTPMLTMMKEMVKRSDDTDSGDGIVAKLGGDHEVDMSE